MEKRAAVWIDTVLYTLIGLAIIASLLAVITPKISELKDRFTIQQTIQSMNTLDDTILRAREATGMTLNYVIYLNKGDLSIDAINDRISWQSQSNYGGLSEENVTVNITAGKMSALTVPYQGAWKVMLSMDYTPYNINITINGQDAATKTLSPANLPYSIWIANNGTTGGKQQIDFSI